MTWWQYALIVYGVGFVVTLIIGMRQAWKDVAIAEKEKKGTQREQMSPNIDDDGGELLGLPLIWPLAFVGIVVIGGIWLLGCGLSAATKPREIREIEQERIYRELPDLRTKEARQSLAG